MKLENLLLQANLNKYLAACRAIGVSDSDLFTILDFSDSKRDMKQVGASLNFVKLTTQVVQNIFAVGRQVQALDIPNIPKLGVTVYRTREEQLALDAKKRERKEKEAEQKKLDDIEAAKRAEAAEVILMSDNEPYSSRNEVKEEQEKLLPRG